MATAGAEVSDDRVVETFGNDDEALVAVHNGVAVRIFHFPIYIVISGLYSCKAGCFI